ncbi:MAG: phosphotransferase [Actinomycetota bacterium]
MADSRKPAVPPVDPGLAAKHLETNGYRPTEVIEVGVGNWSICFGFGDDDRPLVIRYGHHRTDFDIDRAAHGFAGPALPIPEVLQIGRAFPDRYLGGDEPGCWFAISERVNGKPLELVDSEQWRRLVPSVVEALEAMRTAPLPDRAGWGGWRLPDGDGTSSPPVGAHRNWRDHLLSVADQPNDGRIAGWKDRLASKAGRLADFGWGLEQLEGLVDDALLSAVEPGVSHQDMLYRNVHVVDDRITGLFDWGNAIYADHLYELALFEFWNPYYPALDVDLLRTELEAAWDRVGHTPEKVEERLRVCHLHNGLVHIVYGAFVQNWDALDWTAARMRTLGRADR